MMFKVESLRPILIFLCLSTYITLCFHQFTLNELEETYNSSVSLDKFIDFDEDGFFDLDDDNNEEEDFKSSKVSIDFYFSHHFALVSIKKNIEFYIFRDNLNGFLYISQILRPPRLF